VLNRRRKVRGLEWHGDVNIIKVITIPITSTKFPLPWAMADCALSMRKRTKKKGKYVRM